MRSRAIALALWANEVNEWHSARFCEQEVVPLIHQPILSRISSGR